MSGMTEGMTGRQRLALADSMFRAMGLVPVATALAHNSENDSEQEAAKVTDRVADRVTDRVADSAA